MFIITLVVANFGWLFPQDPSNRDFLVWGADVVNEYDKAVLIENYLQSASSDTEVVPL